MVGEAFAEFPGHHLGFHGFVFSGSAFFHQGPPFGHCRLCPFQKFPVFIPLQHRQKLLEGSPAVANQADFYRVPESDSRRIKIDLDGPGLSGLGIKFHIRKRRSDEKQGIAILQSLLRGRGT